MTSYTVTAANEQDAIDIAKRRATDDGLTVKGIGRRPRRDARYLDRLPESRGATVIPWRCFLCKLVNWSHLDGTPRLRCYGCGA